MKDVQEEMRKARLMIDKVAATERFRERAKIAARELQEHGRFEIGFKATNKPYFSWSSALHCGQAFFEIVELLRTRYTGFRGKLAMVHSGGLTLGPALLYSLQLPQGLVLMPTARVPEPKLETRQYSTAYAAREPLAVQQSLLRSCGTAPEERLVIVIDDAVEDGGTALAICDLLESEGFGVVEVACLYAMGCVGQERLRARGIPLFAVRTDSLEDIVAHATRIAPETNVSPSAAS